MIIVADPSPDRTLSLAHLSQKLSPTYYSLAHGSPPSPSKNSQTVYSCVAGTFGGPRRGDGRRGCALLLVAAALPQLLGGLPRITGDGWMVAIR